MTKTIGSQFQNFGEETDGFRRRVGSGGGCGRGRASGREKQRASGASYDYAGSADSASGNARRMRARRNAGRGTVAREGWGRAKDGGARSEGAGGARRERAALAAASTTGCRGKMCCRGIGVRLGRLLLIFNRHNDINIYVIVTNRERRHRSGRKRRRQNTAFPSLCSYPQIRRSTPQTSWARQSASAR